MCSPLVNNLLQACWEFQIQEDVRHHLCARPAQSQGVNTGKPRQLYGVHGVGRSLWPLMPFSPPPGVTLGPTSGRHSPGDEQKCCSPEATVQEAMCRTAFVWESYLVSVPTASSGDVPDVPPPVPHCLQAPNLCSG